MSKYNQDWYSINGAKPPSEFVEPNETLFGEVTQHPYGWKIVGHDEKGNEILSPMGHTIGTLQNGITLKGEEKHIISTGDAMSMIDT